MEKVISQASEEEDIDGGTLVVISDSLMFLNVHKRVSGIEKIYAVIGGFHISGINKGLKMGEFLRKLNVRLVSPCHCTSDDAKEAIARILGERYVKNGSGKVTLID